jgi:beta-xylosidase
MTATLIESIAPPSFPWVPDLGNGRYRNPVIHADYSDPDVIRHGDDFWMVASSFNCAPGLPILHSRDLVNWTLVGHAIAGVPHPRYAQVQLGAGVWAPSIRFNDGKFYVVFAMPDEGVYAVSATHPAGPWSQPWLMQEAKGWIDPCPFWDDDGQAYLAHAYSLSRSGKKERIHLRPMSPDCRRLLGEGRELFHTPQHLYLEGPKLYKLNGFYYIFAPGGGVPTGWQVAFRSRNIWGPYEEKVVLEQGATAINGPHQGALIDMPDGTWWFIHFQDMGAFGRVVHLQPVEWKDDGWPLIGQDYDGNGIGEPVSEWAKPRLDDDPVAQIPESSDDFSGSKLRPQWQWHANSAGDWASLTDRPGWLGMRAVAFPDLSLHLFPAFLGQKFPARQFAAETSLDCSALPAGVSAGLAVVGGLEHGAVAVRRAGAEIEIVSIDNGSVSVIKRVSTSAVRFRVSVDADGTCSFSFASLGIAYERLAHGFRADGGNWIGAKVGLFAVLDPQAIPQRGSKCAYFSEFTFSSRDALVHSDAVIL